MRIALAGAGAFGEKHLDGLKLIDGVEITSIISRTDEQAAAVAEKYGAKHSSTELEDALARDDVDAVIATKGLKQMSDSGALLAIVDEVIARNAKSVEEFRAGKDKAFNALVGQVMKASKGKANPQQVNDLLKARLG